MVVRRRLCHNGGRLLFLNMYHLAVSFRELMGFRELWRNGIRVVRCVSLCGSRLLSTFSHVKLRLLQLSTNQAQPKNRLGLRKLFFQRVWSRIRIHDEAN